jgi:flagellar protein FlaG
MDIKQVANPPQSPAPQQQRVAAPASPTTGPAPSAGVAAQPKSAVDKEQLEAAVKELNKSYGTMNTGLEFSVDKEAHETIVKVVDQSTKEVLRQIPSEEALEMAKALDKMQGLLIQNQA